MMIKKIVAWSLMVGIPVLFLVFFIMIHGWVVALEAIGLIVLLIGGVYAWYRAIEFLVEGR